MLANDNEGINMLEDFGLTTLQAKIYLILSKTDKSTARVLSEKSKIIRQDVYRLLIELFDLGFVEKIIATPTEFRAIPIDKAISDLINLRNQETIELQTEASNLLASCIGEHLDDNAEKQEFQFEMISTKKAQLLKTSEMLNETKNSVALVAKLQFLTFFFPSVINKKSKDSVNVRIVTDKPWSHDSLWNELRGLSQRNLFKIRYLPSAPPCTVLLFDDKEMALAMSTEKEIQEMPFLWSSNSNFIKMAQLYTKTAWEKAEEV